MRKFFLLLCMVGLSAFLAVGCAPLLQDLGLCTCQPEIVSMAPEAKLVGLECQIAKYDGVDSLWFHLALKNVSSEPKRFKVNIYLPDGRGVGGLVPVKTNKGLVKPGQTVKVKYPVKGVAEKPDKVELIVKIIEM